MSVYPDNENREGRVKQLITQTSTIQSLFIDVETSIKKTNDDTAKTVEILSKRAGYPTVEQYIQAGTKALTPAQKANYQNLTDSLVKNNSALNNSKIAFGAIGTLGVFLKIGVPKIVNIVCKFSCLVVGMRGVLRGLILMFKGAFEDGWATIRTFSTLIKGNYQRAIHVGEDITQKVATNLRWLRRAGKILQWAGILAEVGMFIYTVVEGAKQKELLQNAIIETCCTRFGVKKIQLLLNQTVLWNSKVAGVVSLMSFYQEKMEEQVKDPPESEAMRITQALIDKEVTKSIDKMIDAFDKELEECNPDSKVLGELAILDNAISSGEKAWTNEDPTLAQMKKWLEEHPLKDANGNNVPVEGPAFHDIGLQWKGESVAADKDGVAVNFTGKNETDKGQRFRNIHLSFSVSNTAANALFNGTGTSDVSVEIVPDGEVTGVGKEFGATYKTEDSCVKINIAPGNGAEMITLPAGKSLKFKVTGKTGKAGSTGCLVREEWYPFGDKNWEDIMVTKQ